MRAVVVVIALLVCCAAPIDTSSNQAIDAPMAATDGKRVYHDAPRAVTDGGGASDGGFTCRNQVTSGNDQGHHNPGMDCMDSCHNHGFTAAGTLYTDAGGATIVSGATVTVIDSIGNTYDFASQTNGNFYTSFALLPPISVYVSECPTIDMMAAQLATDAQGGCNQTGCHASGSTQGRVHLP
jgi:hypothetical protein